MSAQVAPARVVDQAANGGVLIKLIIFSLSLAIVPISMYFGSLKYVWNGNSTYAAMSAIFAANIVLVSYIIVSILEDRPAVATVDETKKSR
ncbi:hypothetical protein BD410DRAFT_892966 [Rickenella mellea]|uniref:Vacuolar ATPase assembly integral membrane protein VMA21 n=1 Tax=Rickenella mellea TaxID=50990 RepID=A0A4R5XG03_9AGAM|nr:hypothetical protein BD410DRAFT_892966 [Rickenella mellea]